MYDHVRDGAETYPEGVRIYIHATVSDVGVDAEWGIPGEDISIYRIESQRRDALVVKRMTKIPDMKFDQSQRSNILSSSHNKIRSDDAEVQMMSRLSVQQSPETYSIQASSQEEVKVTDVQGCTQPKNSSETEPVKASVNDSPKVLPSTRNVEERQRQRQTVGCEATTQLFEPKSWKRMPNYGAQQSAHFTTDFAAYQQHFIYAQRMLEAAQHKASRNEQARNGKCLIPIAPRFPVNNHTFAQTMPTNSNKAGRVYPPPQENNDIAEAQDPIASATTAGKRKRISLPLTATMKTHRIRVAQIEAGVTANDGSLDETASENSKESGSCDEGKSPIGHKNADHLVKTVGHELENP